MRFLICSVLALSSCTTSQAIQVAYDDHAVVTPRKTERAFGKGQDPVVSIEPVVTGLRPPVVKRLRKALEMKNVLGSDVYEMFYKRHWMYGYDYRVTYNRNHILSISFTYNAYFADHSRQLTFDLRDGHLIKPQDLFIEGRIPDLAKQVEERLKQEIAQIVRQSELDKYLLEAQGPLKVTVADLDELAIDEKGITIFYKAGFHHTAKRVEPEGRYFFKYAQLQEFLKPDSVVSQFIK